MSAAIQITDSINLRVEDYCEYCPDFRAYSESIDITVLADLPKHKAVHVIKCENADRCEAIRKKVKEEMEAKREKAEEVQCDVRGRKDKDAESGADSDNGQSDGGADCISDVRKKENQSSVSDSDKSGWRERMMQHFLRGH